MLWMIIIPENHSIRMQMITYFHNYMICWLHYYVKTSFQNYIIPYFHASIKSYCQNFIMSIWHNVIMRNPWSHKLIIGRPKTAKTVNQTWPDRLLFKRDFQNRLWNFSSSNIKKVTDFTSLTVWTAENGVWLAKTAKPLMKHGQIGYVWSEISKTVFDIF